MPRYKYIARTKEGKPEEGFLEAQNDDELIGILQSRELTVITFKKAEEKAEKEGVVSRRRKMHHGVKLDDLITFSRQLATLLSAGITLLRSLEIVSVQIESRLLYEALEAIKKDISAGSSLRAAVAKHPKIFSNLWVNIIETGETTGQLPFALEQLNQYMESSAALIRKIKTAMVYPVVVLCVALLAIAVFILKIIPMFHSIYSGFGATLPVFTQIVFSFCLVVKKYTIIFLGLAVATVLAVHYYGRTYQGKRRLDSIKLNLFLVGDIIRHIAAVRFANGLSMLIKSGTPILHALDIIIETSGNIVIMEMFQKVKQSVREGKSMAEPLLSGGLLPEMLAHMVGVGEESGELAAMLESAAKFYGERVDATVTRLASLFEPFLIVFIGVTVGIFVIAMFLPIFGLSGVMF